MPGRLAALGAALLAGGVALQLRGCAAAPAASGSALPPPGAESRPPGSPPELPRVAVEMPPATPGGPARLVRAGEDLQDAIDEAAPGDVLELQAGAVFGPLRLPRKSGDGWITIRSAALDQLPARGQRVGPQHAALMAKIEAGSGSAIEAAPGAHHYHFLGIEVRPRAGAFVYDLVRLGQNERSLDDQPHHVVFERCYLHGDRRAGGRRGIALNARHVAVLDSYLSDFKEAGADSQALAGWNGLGPFAIVNNTLEGAGENLIFGGADPSIENLVPSDIEVRGNHLRKPLAWKPDEPGHEEGGWTVKNLFELKNARRVLVEGNVFENNWVAAQDGFGILFTVRNQDGRAPWSVVEDVTFRGNVVRHSASGIYVLAHDDNFPSQQLRRVLLRDNLWDDVGGPRWGGGGRLFQVIARSADVVIDHNTARHAGNILTADKGPHAGFVFTNNIAAHNEYGIIGADQPPGLPSLSAYFPQAIVRRNVIAGGAAAAYPADNFFPPSLSQVGFVDLPAGNYALAATSPYARAATDGGGLGADPRAIAAAERSALGGIRP
jgi:hypothetical protein